MRNTHWVEKQQWPNHLRSEHLSLGHDKAQQLESLADYFKNNGEGHQYENHKF